MPDGLRTACFTAAGIALLLSGVVGCADASTQAKDGAEPTGQITSPIVEGTLSTTSQDSVVLVGVYAGTTLESACTGSLVAKNLILTARHCVATIDEPRGLVVQDRQPNTLGILTGVNAFPRAEAGETPVARGSRLFVAQGDALFPTDVALILIDRPINGTLMPLRLNSGGVVGEAITAVGYGRIEGGTISDNRLQRTNLAITRTGPATLPLGNSIASGEFTLGESTCSGDSGGPSISTKTGAVIGVLSRVGNGVAPTATNPAAFCVGTNTVAIYTSLASVKPLVDAAFAAASAQPVLEGQSTVAALADDDEDDAEVTPEEKKEPAPKSNRARRVAQPTESSGCSVNRASSRTSEKATSAFAFVALGLALTYRRRRSRSL